MIGALHRGVALAIDQPTSRHWHSGWISLLGGLAMAAGSALAIAMAPADPESARSLARDLLFVGGVAEIAVGLFGVQAERGLTDIVLGLLSLSAATTLVLSDPSALTFTWLLSAWLLARGIAELVGGLVATADTPRIAAARLVRSLTDLTLGLAALIAALATAFPALLFDWPAGIVRMVLLFVAISLMASAVLHIGLALAFRDAHGNAR